jgi:hypothetical protein
MTATGIRSRKAAILVVLVLVAILIGTVHWSSVAQQQRTVHGVFAGFEPKADQQQALLTALQNARGQLTTAPGVLLSSLYERVGEQQTGATRYLFIATFENMSYIKSAAKNQQLVSLMTQLNNMSQYSRVRIINLKQGKVPDQELQ